MKHLQYVTARDRIDVINVMRAVLDMYGITVHQGDLAIYVEHVKACDRFWEASQSKSQEDNEQAWADMKAARDVIGDIE